MSANTVYDIIMHVSVITLRDRINRRGYED